MSSRRACVATFALTAILFAGCSSFPEHVHDNWCGHAYHGAHLDPTPGDMGGFDAWRGPRFEHEIRIGDPWRGNRPLPEDGTPRWMPGAPHDRGPIAPRPEDDLERVLEERRKEAEAERRRAREASVPVEE